MTKQSYVYKPSEHATCVLNSRIGGGLKSPVEGVNLFLRIGLIVECLGQSCSDKRHHF